MPNFTELESLWSKERGPCMYNSCAQRLATPSSGLLSGRVLPRCGPYTTIFRTSATSSFESFNQEGYPPPDILESEVNLQWTLGLSSMDTSDFSI